MDGDGTYLGCSLVCPSGFFSLGSRSMSLWGRLAGRRVGESGWAPETTRTMPSDTRELLDSLCTRASWFGSLGTLVGRNNLRRTANEELECEDADEMHESESVPAEGGGVSDKLRALSEMRKRERLAVVIA